MGLLAEGKSAFCRTKDDIAQVSKEPVLFNGRVVPLSLQVRLDYSNEIAIPILTTISAYLSALQHIRKHGCISHFICIIYDPKSNLEMQILSLDVLQKMTMKIHKSTVFTPRSRG